MIFVFDSLYARLTIRDVQGPNFGLKIAFEHI